jgi:chromosome partitioning protein
MRIPIVNRKGGVAKTTTAINLGAALAQATELGIATRDYTTLIVDMDPQASATYALATRGAGRGPDLGHVLIDGASADEAIRPTSTPNLILIGACEALGDETVIRRLRRVDGFHTHLRDALARLETPIDVVLLDCPPAIGLPMTLAMVAGQQFIVPTKLERFSLHGTGQLFRFMDRMIALRSASAEPVAGIMGILLTDVNYQLHDALDRETALRREYGLMVFDTVIRRNVTVERAQTHSRTVFQDDPRLRSSGAQCYRNLAAEVLLRGVAAGRVHPDTLSREVLLRGRRLGLLRAERTCASSDGAPLPAPDDHTRREASHGATHG